MDLKAHLPVIIRCILVTLSAALGTRVIVSPEVNAVPLQRPVFLQNKGDRS